MTIICVRDGVMAADSSEFQGLAMISAARKIVRSPTGAVGAATGSWRYIERFQSWMLLGLDDEARPCSRVDYLAANGKYENDDFTGLVLRASGDVISIDVDGFVSSCDRAFHAIGGPYEMALGAMHAGASAEYAVDICCEHHAYARGPVQFELPERIER